MDWCRTNKALEGTLILTENQTNGRGQQNKSWVSAPGNNLTFSIVLKPGIILPDVFPFRLNKAIGLAIFYWLERYFPEKTILKWPNDIFLNQKKICGTLTENIIQGNKLIWSVIGIGMNVNERFITTLPFEATSLFQESGSIWKRETILEELLPMIEKYYLQTKSTKAAVIDTEYNKLVADTKRIVSLQLNDKLIKGTVEGVDNYGRLIFREKNSKTSNLYEQGSAKLILT